jgi:arylsulfatase A-like enzyme
LVIGGECCCESWTEQRRGLLDQLGVTDNTIVMDSTDNGPHMNTWPDGAMTPFRNEKNSNWEGAFRTPLLVRWLGKISAGVVVNDIVQHYDWLPTQDWEALKDEIRGKGRCSVRPLSGAPRVIA